MQKTSVQETPVELSLRGSGLSVCRCCAPVPLSEDSYGRILNSPGTWSPGPSTSFRLKQQDACTPTLSPDRGKPSDPPAPP